VLVEGSGGLLVPLGEGYFVADLIERLGCEVLVISQNKLGTINHTLLTVRCLTKLPALGEAGGVSIKVVLMNHGQTDKSCTQNGNILRELLAPVPLLEVPFLGETRVPNGCEKKSEKNRKNSCIHFRIE
jgi:dethiobiotin synthetase